MSDEELTCPDCEWPTAIGIEVRGEYDGVLFWSCGRCGHAWPRRFTGPASRLSLASKAGADQWNRIPQRDKEELAGKGDLSE